MNKIIKTISATAIIIGIIAVCGIGEINAQDECVLYDLENRSVMERFINEPDKRLDIINGAFEYKITDTYPIYDFLDKSYGWYNVLKSDYLIPRYITVNNPDIKIYGKKAVRPDAFYRFKYEVGDFIYVVTNKGEKIIEYKERHRYEKADGADRISSFDVYYYDDIESFFNKYKAEPVDIYINGEKLEIKGKLCPNGAFTVPALEILERIGMTVEKIQEPECLRVKNDKDDVYLYVLDKELDGYDGHVDILFLREPYYTQWVEHVRNGTEDELYNWLPSLNGDMPFCRDYRFRCDDSIPIERIETINLMISTFGVEIVHEKTEDGKIYLSSK